MDQFLAFFSWENLQNVVTPLSIFVGILIIGTVIRKILFDRLIRWARKTNTRLDDIIFAAARGPFLIWVLIFAAYMALRFSLVTDNILDVINKVLLVLAIISFTLFAANLAVRLIKEYSAKAETALPVSSLTQNIARIVIFAIGILIILGSLNQNITPILATLGVGGLAVALALQDTLSNFFAGFYIAASRQIKIGDYLKLDSGEEGYVVDIHWRTTKIRALSNNIILVPNEKLSRAIVTNYNMPDKELAVLVNVGVHYRSDLNRVEKFTIEVASKVMKEVTGGVPTFEPFIRYNKFDAYSINFTVIMRAREFVDQYLITHEFIKQLHDRYSREGIIIPYPIRALNYEQEKQQGPSRQG